MWNYTTTYTVGCSPCVADGVVYISSNNGNLYAFADTADTVTARNSFNWLDILHSRYSGSATCSHRCSINY
ncbi:PQQ-binding-like beta-propeller repeat protein [Candidatus Bathyarchaeota archaeon]|nr:PQQ-binding-like beta-propeller repeat protein [Candidatus Bathyarchaeota archaeon]